MLLLLLLLLLAGCTASSNHEIPAVRISDGDIMLMMETVEKNDPQGLVDMHRIYLNEAMYGSAVSGRMKFLLDFYLYRKTPLWVAAFSSMKEEDFKWKTFTSREVAHGNLGFADVLDQVLWNLNTFEGSADEKAFALKTAGIIRDRMKLLGESEVEKGYR